jgi:hypothetical protein
VNTFDKISQATDFLKKHPLCRHLQQSGSPEFVEGCGIVVLPQRKRKRRQRRRNKNLLKD